MKKIYLGCIVVIAVVAGGIVLPKGVEAVRVKDDGVSERQLADELVGSTLNAYRNFSIPRFMSIFSDDFSPDRMQLINNIDSSYSKIIVVDIEYFINKVMRDNGILAVTFKWQKRVQQRNIGQLVLTEGNATFVFEEQDGSWKIIRIKGNNPLM